jgi:hypothetical protein
MELSTRKNELPIASGADESTSDKLWREARLLKEGATGVVDAARDALGKDSAETAAKVGLSFAIGAGMAFLGRGHGFGKMAVRTVAAAGTVAFASDIAYNAKAVSGAIRDTWNSEANFGTNAEIMKNSLGQFVFDTALMSGGGILGAKVGQRFVPQIPRGLMREMQIEPSGFSGDYLNKTRSADSFAFAMKTAQAKGNTERVARYVEPLKGALGDMKTYSQYIGEEIASKGATKGVDWSGVRNTLTGRNPQQRAKIDALALELKGMTGDDLTNPTVLNRIISNGRQIEDIIRGPGSRFANQLTGVSVDARKAQHFTGAGDPDKAGKYAASLKTSLGGLKTYSESLSDDAAEVFLSDQPGSVRKLDALINGLRGLSQQDTNNPPLWLGVISKASDAERLVRGPSWMRAMQWHNLLLKAPNI